MNLANPMGIASFGMGGSPDPSIPFGGTINFRHNRI